MRASTDRKVTTDTHASVGISIRLLRCLGPLLLPIASCAIGCTSLPDVKPFAASTASLAAAAGSHYRDIASDVESLKPIQIPGVPPADNAQLKETQRIFKATTESLDRLFSAMTAYSEKVAGLAASGETGASAAASILESVEGFATVAGITGVPAGPIVDGFKAIAEEFTRMEAKQSLTEAIAAADPGVQLVAKQFNVIYGDAMNMAASGIRNTRRLNASIAAGPNVIGFSDNVKQNYNAYYRVLNGLVANADPESPASTWRGFCKAHTTASCHAVSELQAVGLVEARMAAIRPIVDAYDREIESIEATLKHRQSTSKAVVKAVDAWALEHRKLLQSLRDGTTLSAFNLQAALLELATLLGQNP